jgi:ribosomal protein L7/L12
MTNDIKPIDLSDPSIEKVVEALKSGKKIEAIMIYRSTHNISLAESQKIVEEMEVKLGL